jgi:hypothetical protein
MKYLKSKAKNRYFGREERERLLDVCVRPIWNYSEKIICSTLKYRRLMSPQYRHTRRIVVSELHYGGYLRGRKSEYSFGICKYKLLVDKLKLKPYEEYELHF